MAVDEPNQSAMPRSRKLFMRDATLTQVLGKIFADHLHDYVLVLNKFKRLKAGEVGVKVLQSVC